MSGAPDAPGRPRPAPGRLPPDALDRLADAISFHPHSDEARLFRQALGRYATGVTVVSIATRRDDGAGSEGRAAEWTGVKGGLAERIGAEGMTANSFASVSLDPPLILWCPARASARHDLFAQAPAFAIHVLGAEQLDLCLRFTRGGAGFAGLEVALNDDGIPVIPGVAARFDCRTHATHPGGDHTIVVGRVMRVTVGGPDDHPLVFAAGRFGAFAAENG